ADDVLWAIHSFRSPVLTRIVVDTGVMQQAVFEADAIGPDPAGAFWGWITGSGQRSLARIAAVGPYDDPASYRTFGPSISGSPGVIVASDGRLWTWDVVQLHRLGPDRDSLGHLAHRSFTSTVGSLNGAILAEGADGEIWTLA